MHSNVPFEQLWSRLKGEFKKAPGPKPGVHILSIRKWTQAKGYLPSPPITAIWKGGDVIYCDTKKTDSWRSVPEAEFRKALRSMRRLPG